MQLVSEAILVSYPLSRHGLTRLLGPFFLLSFLLISARFGPFAWLLYLGGPSASNDTRLRVSPAVELRVRLQLYLATCRHA